MAKQIYPKPIPALQKPLTEQVNLLDIPPELQGLIQRSTGPTKEVTAWGQKFSVPDRSDLALKAVAAYTGVGTAKPEVADNAISTIMGLLDIKPEVSSLEVAPGGVRNEPMPIPISSEHSAQGVIDEATQGVSLLPPDAGITGAGVTGKDFEMLSPKSPIPKGMENFGHSKFGDIMNQVDASIKGVGGIVKAIGGSGQEQQGSTGPQFTAMPMPAPMQVEAGAPLKTGLAEALAKVKMVRPLIDSILGR